MGSQDDKADDPQGEETDDPKGEKADPQGEEADDSQGEEADDSQDGEAEDPQDEKADGPHDKEADGPQDKEADGADWIRSAIADVGDEEDEVGINVVSNDGLTGLSAGGQAQSDEVPYVVLLQAAVSMVKSGEISMDEFAEGVKKLDVIADNALKIYSIPAVKNDLPGKLTEHQNAILSGLHEQLLVLKEGLGMLLAYPESQAIDDLETGLETAVGAYHAMRDVQKNADAEYAAIAQREKEEKALRAQKAAAVEAESGS